MPYCTLYLYARDSIEVQAGVMACGEVTSPGGLLMLVLDARDNADRHLPRREQVCLVLSVRIRSGADAVFCDLYPEQSADDLDALCGERWHEVVRLSRIGVTP